MTALLDKPAYGPKNLFSATIAARTPLGSPEARKTSMHVELDFESDAPHPYACGDSLGVYAENAKEDVTELLHLSGLTKKADKTVTLGRSGEEVTIFDALKSHLNILSPISTQFIQLVAQCAKREGEKAHLDEILNSPKDVLKQFTLKQHHAGILRLAPSAQFENAQELVNALSPIRPRLYSISSSPLKRPNAASLAVALVSYELNGTHRHGLASNWLCKEAPVEDSGQKGTAASLKCFVAKGSLRLPEDSDKDIIMIGPGVGIAPFRAFLQQREITGAKGRNWLLYGHRREERDFYYKNDIQAWQRSGLLTHFSPAWSRDTEKKHYVQHLIEENAEEFWSWIQNGATIYICGEREHMSQEVLNSLSLLAALNGACQNSPEDRSAWLKEMKSHARLQLDVY